MLTTSLLLFSSGCDKVPFEVSVLHIPEKDDEEREEFDEWCIQKFLLPSMIGRPINAPPYYLLSAATYFPD